MDDVREISSVRFAIRGLIVWLPLALAGCPERRSDETEAVSLPFAGQEIRIGVPPDLGFRAAWEGPLNEWEAQSGAKCHLEEIAQPAAGESLKIFSGTGAPTLALFPLEHAGELISSGCLAPIPENLREEGADGVNWPDLFQGLRDKVASRKGQPMFLPLSASILVCYFRQDLLQAAGLKPPQTWDEYQQLLDNLEQWAPGLNAVEPWGEHFRATMFLARAVSLAQHPGQYSLFFDIDTGDPLIDSPAFVQALQAARAALAKMPGGVLRFSPAECRIELLSGRAALAIAREPSAIDAASSVDAASEPAGKPVDAASFGAIRLPGSREVYDASRQQWETSPDKGTSYVTLTAFSGWGIGASSAYPRMQIDAAWHALLKIGGPDLVSGFPPTVVGLCRESQLQSGTFPVNFGGDMSASLVDAVAQSLRNTRIVAELPIAGRDEFRLALTAALGTALDGSKSPAEALRAAGEDWRKTIARIGPAQHRDNYRMGLGLSPKPSSSTAN
jgi:ABC-type glycerol-3-phosphate transport system substrate-binding protein